MKIKYKNLWDAAESVLRRKFIILNIYIRKEKGPQTNNLSFYLKK